MNIEKLYPLILNPKRINSKNNLKNNRYLADGINPIINNKSNESPYRRNSEILEFNKKTNQIQTEKRLLEAVSG